MSCKSLIFTGESVRAILANKKTQTRRVRPSPPRVGLAVGDIVRVKESWSPDHQRFYPNYPIVYRADAGNMEIKGGKAYSPETGHWYPFRWRSPLFMPARHCRLWLRIADVRVARLKSIDHTDAVAEGCVSVADFLARWDAINAPAYPAKANPWVWAYTFEKTEKPETEKPEN